MTWCESCILEESSDFADRGMTRLGRIVKAIRRLSYICDVWWATFLSERNPVDKTMSDKARHSKAVCK